MGGGEAGKFAVEQSAANFEVKASNFEVKASGPERALDFAVGGAGKRGGAAMLATILSMYDASEQVGITSSMYHVPCTM